ncbi:Cytochrome c-552 precursor [Gimesia panareensis]|uniref:Cytochrome c-552 n=1 Tax=Gimesia panareensis TaxID=2527978 RepID=A0A518FW13_9PLAN|nr:cytochrome c [Gimesia panareensis]QDV20534.1 Cytochrome c-552 precursor [Gimesia panareensis]
MTVPEQSGNVHSLDPYEQENRESTDVPELHRAVLREQFEPSEGEQRAPLLLLLGIIAMAMFGGWYLSAYDGGFDPHIYDGPNAFTSTGRETDKQAPKAIDPMLLGKRIYNNCLSCHQPNGEGVPGKYPPLNQSEWVAGDDRILARILLSGLSGPITVKDKRFNGQMPGWGQLSDRDLAAVLTYVRASWENEFPAVSESTITEARSEIGTREAWTLEELKSLELPDNAKNGSNHIESEAPSKQDQKRELKK